jgi:hydroxymethylpyrimidine pyrophosphatase-like HAD family hydrolase
MPVWTHSKPLTVFSGGVSVQNEIMIRSHEIPRKHVEEILELCLRNKYKFVMDNLLHYYHPDSDVPLGILDINCKQYRIQDIDEMLNSQIFKILLFDIQSMGLFAEYAGANNLLIKHHSYSECFDIVPVECNKYLGVLPFIQGYANEDIFIFGNDYNDYELLKTFNNSILFGDIKELQELAKLNLGYNEKLQYNFSKLIHGIIYGAV